MTSEPVVAVRWVSCPYCGETGALFMVGSDGAVRVRCTNAEGCRQTLVLGGDNFWQEPGYGYE